MNDFQLVEYGILLALNVVLVIMSRAMYQRWKNDTYIKMLVASLLALIATAGMFMLSAKTGPFYMFFVAMHTVGVIIMQIALFRLYFVNRKTPLYIHLGATIASILIMAGSLFLPIAMTSLLLFFILAATTIYSIIKLSTDTRYKIRSNAIMVFYGIHMILQVVTNITAKVYFQQWGLLFYIVSALLIFIMIFERLFEFLQIATFTSARDDLTTLYTRKHFLQQARQLAQKNAAYGVLYIDFNESHLTPKEIAGAREQLSRIGKSIVRIMDGKGFGGRYEDNGIAILVSNPAILLSDLSNELKNRLDVEAAGQAGVGYINMKPNMEVEQLIAEAKAGAVRTQQSGMDLIFDLEHSRILND